MSERRYFSSEAVTEGHPDKVCDQIADAVLDAILAEDPAARVACEVAVTTGLVLVMGEISTISHVDVAKIARDTIREIGYTDAAYGFDADTCAILTSLDRQSDDIALGVDRALEAKEQAGEQTGAGDQGMMYGYACRETDSYMPLPLVLAQDVCQRLAEVRKSGTVPFIRPDGKAQMTVAYVDGKPERIDTVVVSTQHDPDVDPETLREAIRREVLDPVLPKALVDDRTRVLINPTGRFVTGGPQGDSGLTGRKIIADTYGGAARHGGGAFSGKDPTKVDRSASYAARYVAKHLVAAGLCDRCEIQIAYAIGVAEPVSVYVETFGTSPYTEDSLRDLILEHFDLTPDGIIRDFDLRRPIYREISCYGHFGRPELNLPWEALDKVEALKEAAKDLPKRA